MQDRYVGDIGDFVKYSLLNCLADGQRLGVAWYLYPDEGHNADGKHVDYLTAPDEWRGRDPWVFDRLRTLVEQGRRSVADVANSGCLKSATFFDESLVCEDAKYRTRASWRAEWFRRALAKLENCDLVFADPDNGLLADARFRMHNRKDWKSIPEAEARRLARDRTSVIYHHNTRRKGGHAAEILYWMELLGAGFAVRSRYFSARTFFVVNPRKHMLENARGWAEGFGDKIEIMV